MGQQPSSISSVAELMLHDTNTNVYEDRQVNFFQETTFTIRGQKKRIMTKKEKERNEQDKILRL